MLVFWLRKMLLRSSRLLGAIGSVFRQTLVLHLMAFLLIAALLWGVDKRGMIWGKSVDAVKNGISRLSNWRRASAPRSPSPSDNKKNLEAKDANASGPSTPAPAKAEPAQLESTGTANDTPKDTPKPVAPEPGKSPAEDRPESKLWLTTWNVLSIWAFSLVVWSVVQARRRLVITFDDRADKQSGEDSVKQTGIDVPALGALVAAELASLSVLFGEFEEERSLQSTPEAMKLISLPSMPEKMKLINATFQTESTGESLENTISSETKFSFGPLQIPVGLILGLVGRIVQGPRVIGQIHRDGSQRIITVRLIGRLGNRVWIVLDPALASAADKITWRPAAEVANDLACRLFAELAMDRTVTWQALSQFVAGVRAFRTSLQTPKEHKLNLKEAEHRLLQAQAEDPGFDLAFYNLGVVYSAQGKLEAASTAFTHAAEMNKRRAGTQYALALTNFNLAQLSAQRQEPAAAEIYLSKSIEFCDRALELKPPAEQNTRILALKGMVLWWRAWRRTAGSGIQAHEFRSAGKMVRRAVAKAWRVLCRVEFGLGISGRGKTAALEQARRLASQHLANLAQMSLEVAGNMKTALAEKDEDLAQASATLQENKDLSRPSRLLLGITLRGGFLLIWVGTKLRSPKRIRAISLRVACYSLLQAGSLTPAEPSVWLALGKTYLQRAQFKKAIPALRAAARLSPGSSDAWGFLARAYAACQRYNEALDAAQNFLASVSEVTAESLDSLAAALGAIKDPYSAIQQFIASIAKEKGTRGEAAFFLWFLRIYIRLSYRLAGREFMGLANSSEQLKSFLTSPDALKQVLDNLDAASNRTRQLTEFPAKVRALREQGKEGVEQLKTLMTEKAEHNLTWEVGEVGHNLALLYLKLGQLTEASKCLSDTIAYLEKCLPGEIQRRGLYSLLARALGTQGGQALAIALEKARKGVALDPTSPYERNELGWAYWRLADYAAAQSTWEEVRLLTPDEPQLHVRLGMVHLARAPQSKDRLGRRNHIDSATQHLKTALDLLEEAGPDRNQARWLLAQVYALADKYADAVRELRTLERTDYFPLAVQISLADASLANDDWVEAEGRFRKATADVDQRIAQASQGVNEVPESPSMFEHVLGTISAWAHLGVAASLAEREILLDQALREVECARETIVKVTNEELKKEWHGNCFFHEGSIQLKRDHVDEAVDCLEQALSARVDSSTYFTFANALTRKSELTNDPGSKSQLVRRAINYYQEALRLDWNGSLEPKINRALAQLQQPVPIAQAASAK